MTEKNGKPKTLTQLGLPKGYRLTNTIRQNITRVAIRTQLREEALKLLYQECELMHCANEYVYPIDLRVKYNQASSELKGSPVVDHFDYTSKEMKFGFIGSEVCLGTAYSYSRDKDKMMGIMTYPFINQFIVDQDIYWTDEVKEFMEPAHLWVDQFIAVVKPSNSDAVISPGRAWERLPKKLRLKIMAHCKKCQELKDRADTAQQKLRMILAEYNSPVKLGNDIPETVAWMLEAEHMNEHGRMCTDVTSADTVQDMRKELGLR